MRRAPTPSSSLKRKGANNGKKTKKRKLFSPRSFLECQSITHVVGFPPQHELVTTPVVSDFVKELFLERFVKEIVKPFQPERTTKKQDQDGGTTTPTTEINSGYFHVMVGGKLVKRRRTSQDTFQSNRTTTKTSTELNPLITVGVARKRRMWKENIVIGTNQCLRLLENLNSAHCRDTDAKSTRRGEEHLPETSKSRGKPSLVVIAKDIYPPTMCCAVPVLAKRLGIPLLVLPGKASLELGRALNAKRTSILIFCCGDNETSVDRGSTDVLEGKACQDKEMTESRAAMASFVSFITDQISQNEN